MANYVAYYRVSTAKQGASGLGLEAQQEAVRRFLRAEDRIVASYTEVETGKRDDRPQLSAALEVAKEHDATLIIAKLDRLARSVYFISGLMRAKIKFVACDNPHANKLTLHILAAVAETEADMISERVKAALAAAKARGVKLGGFRGRIPENAKQRTAALADVERVRPTIEHLRLRGVTTLLGIAGRLDALGIKTSRGKLWTATGVRRILVRLARLDSPRTGSETQ